MFFQKIPAIVVVLTDRDVLTVQEELISQADIIELRVDMFENLVEIEKIFLSAKKKFNLPIICTVRSPSEGGQRYFKDRIELYKKAMPFCNFFDIEIFSEEIKILRQLSWENKISLIASYHRFDMTPSFKILEKVFKEGKKNQADIVKIATMVNYKSDLETLLQFTLKHKNDSVIVIGMGIKGMPSRVINPVFGSLVTYASLNFSSAPGQIPLKEMIHIFKTLGLR